MAELFARDQDEWRAWLAENHTTAAEVWLVYWKKSTGRQSITWAQAVEVALCHGWIDGLARGIDEERYMQRFTPRRPKSKWSKVNKETALRQIAAGEMTPLGLAAVEAAKASGEWDRAYTTQAPAPAPDDLKSAIRLSLEARQGRDRLSRIRWDRWLEWLEGTEGRTRTRRINAIVKALETRDNAPVDAQAQRAAARRKS
jgi:uncharacterized protein YdeI (YjbR/CyaY-like superfamily)